MKLPVVLRAVSQVSIEVALHIRYTTEDVLGSDYSAIESMGNADSIQAEFSEATKAGGVHLLYIITPLDSSAAWEASSIHTRGIHGHGSVKMTPYVFTPEATAFKGVGVTDLCPTYFDRNAFHSLLEHFCGRKLSETESAAADDRWPGLTEAIQSSLLLGDMVEIAGLTMSNGSRSGSSARPSRDLKKAVLQFRLSFDAPQLGDFIDDVASAYKKIGESRPRRGASGFNDVFVDGAHKTFDMATRDLNRIAENEFVPYDHNRAIEFYEEVILPHVEKSLWTTNISEFGGNFGRRLDPGLLNVQGQAVKEGVHITRIFVYREGDPGLSQLRDLMKLQINQGIDVKVIEWERFHQHAQAADQVFGTMDFMILDDYFLYITIMDSERKGISQTKFKYDPLWLRVAKELRTQIEDQSTALTKASVGDFPGT